MLTRLFVLVLLLIIGVCDCFAMAPQETDSKGMESVDYHQKLNHKLFDGVSHSENFANDLWAVLDRDLVSKKDQESFFAPLKIDSNTNENKWVGLRKFGRKDWKAGRAASSFLRQNKKAWSIKTSPAMAKYLDQNQEVLDLLVKASEKEFFVQPYVSHGNPKILTTLLPGVMEVKEISQVLGQRALRSLKEGKHKDAVTDVLASYKLASFLAKRRVAIEATQGHLCGQFSLQVLAQILADASLPKTQMIRIQKQLNQVQFDQQLKWHFQNSARWTLLEIGQMAGTPGDPFRNKWPKMFQNADIDFQAVKKEIDFWFDRLVRLDDSQTFSELQSTGNEIVSDLKSLNPKAEAGDAADSAKVGKKIGQILIHNMLPNFLQLYQQQFRFRLRYRIVAAAVELRLKKFDSKEFELEGADLASLDTTTPDRFVDPFCGKPLRFRKTGTSIRLYQGAGSSDTFRVKIPW